MYRKIEVHSFGCIQNVEVRLTNLHAFIGPNDSGKSTLLKVIKVIAATQPDSASLSEDDLWLFHDSRDPQARIVTVDEQGIVHRLTRHKGPTPEKAVYALEVSLASSAETKRQLLRLDHHSQDVLGWLPSRDGQSTVDRLPNPCALVRFDPDALSNPSTILDENGLRHFINGRGSGLAGVYDFIMKRSIDEFASLQAAVCKHFPTVAKLQIENLADRTMRVQVELKNGVKVPASRMSEGLLYFLAFAALTALRPKATLLVEEPENGLHPARIRDLVSILRDLSSKTQVIIATHSPLIINELQPDEVSVVTRDPDAGTRVVSIKETPNFDERYRVYRLGELWLAHADGDQEEALLQGKPRP